ncbi:MAG: hypothetical protein KDC36_01395 [Thermoleophilia bacterium]|nr:hypothetical protein [Thermoleophilia bacterium]
MIRRRLALGLCGLMLAGGTLALQACSSDDGGGDSSSAEAKAGGTYRVATTDFGFNDGFDPSGEYLGWAWDLYTNLLVRPLVGYRHTAGGAGTELLPDLAVEIPEPTDGGTTWTFKIKPGVKFGPPVNRDVTSKDVAYAFQRIGTDSVVAQYGFYYSDIVGLDDFKSGKAKTIAGITTPDDSTIVFKTTKPVGDLPYRLAMPATAPIPPEVGSCFEKAGEYGRYVISSGPYMIKGSDSLDATDCKSMKPISGFNPTKQLSMVRNPNYDAATDDPEMREALPDAFEFIVNTNEKDIFDKIEAGLYDGAVDAVPPDVARRYSQDEAKQDRLKSNPDDSTNYIYMNLAEAPFDDVHVRKAVNWVMDRDALRRAWGGAFYGEIGSHIAPNTLYGDSPDIVDYDPFGTENNTGDPAQAAEEMKLSAYDTNKDGVCDVAACKNVVFLNRSVEPFSKMSPIIIDGLKKLGITVKSRELPTGPAYETSGVIANRIQIGSNARWGKDYPDASTFMVLFDGRNLLPTGNSAYSLVGLTAAQAKDFKIAYPKGGVPSVDAKIDECSELTDSARIACWIELDKQLTEEVVPWVPYMFGANTDLIGPAVTKWDFDQFSGEAAYAHVAVDPSKQK